MLLLKNYKLNDLLRYETDILVIGSGIAGLMSAISAGEENARVTIISKTKLNSGSTPLAQGGISVVMSDEDTFENHINDTLNAGAGICVKPSVEILVKEGKKRINQLIEWGVKFDRTETGKIHLTKEAAHSNNRIIHCSGDATGREIEYSLIKKIRLHENIFVKEQLFAIDLIVINNRCCGCTAYDLNTGQEIFILAERIILAGGGIGQIYRETTNPGEITGDTIAMAYRSGAVLTDMEFVQFHPTTFYLAGAPRFLISESVRGEGAYLINKKKERFMFKYHKDGELAARDIVSRSISYEMIETNTSNVHLDLTHLPAKLIETRFPNILQMCMLYGIDIKKDYIPVRPAEHYFMGGIKTNEFGETNVEGLYACGECACSGVHGANRLASNSLLEGLVFGYRAGKYALNKNLHKNKLTFNSIEFGAGQTKFFDNFNIADAKNSIKSLMWRNIGIFRDKEILSEALKTIEKWKTYLFARSFQNVSGFELQNKIIVGEIIVKAALLREESRGAHFRTDYPESKIELASRHNDFVMK
ncbi:L-aspartate oxidase [Candidatus Dependentiae bacterium]|nr:L-aspartate oxidase [Candidatus Dependentiae bacterium]